MRRSRGYSTTSSIDDSNSHARLPICLCLDTSGSMSGHPINELNAGVRLFYEKIRSNTESRYAADIAIVTFGHSGVECIQNFSQVYENPTPPSLMAEGMTPMGEAVNLALDMLENRRQDYKNVGVQYYHPWLVLMTDGEPNGSASELSRASSRARDLVTRNKLVVFPLGIGRNADLNALAQFSPRITPLTLVGLNFSGFFEWLSKSVDRTSVSNPGNNVPLPPVDGGWASIPA